MKHQRELQRTQHACPQAPKREAPHEIGPEEPLELRPLELAVCSLTSKLDKGQCPVKHQRELQRIQHACPQAPKREAPQDRLWRAT